MKVFVTGGTGFVGREVLRQLVAAGHSVRALVREGSAGKGLLAGQVELHVGDVTDAASLVGALTGCQALIHLVGIIRQFPRRGVTFDRLHVTGTENVLAAAQAQGVSRYLHMSANGTCEHAVSAYHRSKWQAEVAVRASSLHWTILRPSMIFGPGSEFVNVLAKLIDRLPLVPVFGDGQYRLQPVAVEQVAASFVGALAMPETIGSVYHLGGGASYSYDQILDLTAQALGQRRVAKIHQPLLLIKPMIRLMENFQHFPVTSDQLTMLLEGNVCDAAAWATTFNLTPLSYADGIAACLNSSPSA